MSDKLLWGSARPLFRIGTNRYVLNQPVSEHDIKFPKEIVLNQAITGKLYEHNLGHRGIFTVGYDLLDRPSTEVMKDILNSSSDIYMRPHFNFWKEYLIRCVNGFELDRFGKANQPYKGTLSFETINLESTIPAESSGSFDFDGFTKIDYNKGSSWITGDISVELWIKVRAFGGCDTYLAHLIQTAIGYPTWYINLMTTREIKFTTTDNDGKTHNLVTTNKLELDTWYHIIVKRVNTTHKYIAVNGEIWADENDTQVANDIKEAYLCYTVDGLDGLIQIFRVYNTNVNISGHAKNLMIEAIPSSYISALKLWWDFSQGNTDDLSENNNDGVVTGTEQYQKESFPDKGYEINVLT